MCVGGLFKKFTYMEKETKILLAILSRIEKNLRLLMKHLGVEKKEKEENEEKPSPLDRYPTWKEILKKEKGKKPPL